MQKRQFNGWLATGLLAAPWWARGAAGADAPALLLAHKAPERLGDVSRYLVSEKLDGVRAYWDGRRLLSRGGQSIAAPAWFTAHLPAGQSLDGELWAGRGRFEALSAAVRRRRPREAEWQAIRYMLFELPGGEGGFAQRAERLVQIAVAAGWPGLQAVPQQRLASEAALRGRLAEVLREGGEGLMLHEAEAPYQTGRREVLLKLKPQDDAEAVVLAHLPGEGRYAGMLGALRVRNEAGQVFLLGSGFSAAQRRAPPPVGALVSYRYRGLTDKGLPRFASFLRELDGPAAAK
ncbi:DNA ligase [Roseateles sp. DAIF2]|uniref:DNA ligase n=1 Tax=Roseateles sp. DAIF2 TaxID=2714952 RepID=UPI0018A24EB8|nr:DNA ligase [Roseateles sp. DAIF2]QPF73455.1 DNA ligase [Roseateles sp. DAIF2]